MSDRVVTLDFVLARLDSIQTDLRLLRLRDEQREASHQAVTGMLSRQMVELTMSLDERLTSIDARLDRIEQHLNKEPRQRGE